MKTLLMVASLFLAGETVVEKSEPEPILPYVDESCAGSFACQDEVVWELVLLPSRTVVSGIEDMTEEECEALKELAESQAQTEAFTALVCRPRLVERQKI
jgi:hypothetical protein